MNYDRRTVLRGSVAGMALASAPGVLGVGLWPPPALAQAQAAPLETMVFLSKRLDATTAEFRQWYIERHAPDFVSFAKPFLIRYTQDFVERGRLGDVDFDCISEFELRNQESAAGLARALDLPENKATLARHERPGSKPGPNEAHDGPRRFAITEKLLSGPARRYDRPGAAKQAALLRRAAGASAEAFAQAADAFGRQAVGKAGAAAVRVALDVAIPEEGRPRALYDAVIQVWPKGQADLSAAFADPPAAVQLVNIVDLLSYESDLGAI